MGINLCSPWYNDCPCLKAISTVPELQGSTQEVAREKCRRAAELVGAPRINVWIIVDIFQIGGPCITEDTALCFKALNGLPGPYIKYFLTELGDDGNELLSN